MSGVAVQMSESDAQRILNHSWFSQFYILDDGEWDDWIDSPQFPDPVSDWIMDPDNDGYLMQQ